ncbi:hypothetical protein DPEC_G00329180 [Dallia pectoralis]|uniref:Uncharacterized protein n=1 Tax=Dallia pectoralis TaxID=75939 RepID=A0ACC2F8J2_DALPE|nr:hypothetical protein DPEC_G00329180 [Dallia pectoralis]
MVDRDARTKDGADKGKRALRFCGDQYNATPKPRPFIPKEELMSQWRMAVTASEAGTQAATQRYGHSRAIDRTLDEKPCQSANQTSSSSTETFYQGDVYRGRPRQSSKSGFRMVPNGKRALSGFSETVDMQGLDL